MRPFLKFFPLVILLHGCGRQPIEFQGEGELMFITRKHHPNTSVPPTVKYVEYWCKSGCWLGESVLCNPNIDYIFIDSRRRFTFDAKCDNFHFRTFIMPSPTLDGVPNFLAHNENLESTELRLAAPADLNNAAPFSNLRILRLTFESSGRVSSNTIISSPNLEQLVVELSDGNITLDPKVKLSRDIVNLLLPIDLSSHIEHLQNLDSLEYLHVNSWTGIDEEYPIIQNLKGLKYLVINDFDQKDRLHYHELFRGIRPDIVLSSPWLRPF